MYSTITNGPCEASISTFSRGDVDEHHVMLRLTDSTKTFTEQLGCLLDTFSLILGGELRGSVAVFKRYFLSDAANQADDVLASDGSDCAKSIVQQPPLDGTKIALWAYLMSSVSTRITSGGLYEATHGQYRHLWNGSASNLAANSEFQTRLLFNEYVMQLAQENLNLRDHCVRTWLFVNDIDLNYGGVVRARNQVFFTQGLTHDTHYIASTGIGGRGQDPCVLTQMDNYAVGGLSQEQIHYLYAPTHLNRTSDYGVSFERGTYIDYGDRRHIFVSGTASIDNKGQIVHPKDVVSQTRRMWDNVGALLEEGGCSFDDVSQMIVYLRDPADYAVVSALYRERFHDVPFVIVAAAVCRPGWLVEMECMAVKATDNPEFAAL